MSEESLQQVAPHPAQARFTRHRYELLMLAVFFSIALVELFAAHLLVALWSSTAAWVLSALTILALGQIALLVHGMISRPTLLDDSGITVRHGRRSEIFVPLDLVERVEDVAFRPTEKGPQTFRATVLAQPNVAIRLSEPVRHGKRMLSTISMRLDDPAQFLAALSLRLTRLTERRARYSTRNSVTISRAGPVA